ncbi:hypothetical protein EJB05_06582, partial [Eragrostis curvula]
MAGPPPSAAAADAAEAERKRQEATRTAERKTMAERLKAERRRLEAEAARIADALRQLDAEEEQYYKDEEEEDVHPVPDAIRGQHPGWGMLDSVLRDSAGAGTFVYAPSAAAGDFVGISFCFLRPPATSHIHYCRTPSTKTSPSSSSSSNVSGPTVYCARALATHHNMILLSFIIHTRPRSLSNIRCEEFFVYIASPNCSEESVVNQASSLPMLVSVPSCGHTYIHQNMGILCPGDHGEIVVAHLVVTPIKEGPKTDCPVTAELCCTVMDGHELKSLSTKPLRIHYHHGEGENLYWWHTDVIVPIDDKTMCWVDYLRGILVCSDILSPDPVLIYVQLPVDPYKDRENRDMGMGTRGALHAYRNVCITQGGDMKFVDLASFTFWFFGKPAKQLSISPYSTINTWTLSREKLLLMIKQRKAESFVWMKDETLEDDEFIALTKSRNNPCTQLRFPVVDIKNPQTIYFVLGESYYGDCESCLVAINMSTKRIDTSVRYIFGAISSERGDCCSDTGSCKPLYSCNVFYNEPFLCCDLSNRSFLPILIPPLICTLPSSSSLSEGRRSEMATIAVPTPLPSPAADAESLRSWGTDEKALIEILCRRTAAQRAEIRRAYAGLYRESLLDRLRDELSGDFKLNTDSLLCSVRCVRTRTNPKNAMVLWATEPAERDARLANAALAAGGKRAAGDQHAWVLVEVACASTPDHLVAVRRAYRSLFGCSLEEDVAACAALADPLRKLLVSLVRSYRCAEEHVDDDVARLEAAQLAEAVARRKQPHGDEVIRIVSTRSKHQLRATFRWYKQEHSSDIDEDITMHSSSQFAKMLRSAVWCLTSPEKHFAEVIRYSILGLGTDEDTLTRAIVSRAEIDMNNIKEEYNIRFKTTVTSDIVGDTSGDYMDFLLALVGSE